MFCGINGVVFLDSEGTTIYSKYFNTPSLSSSSQKSSFEQRLVQKCDLIVDNYTLEAFLLDEFVVVVKLVNDIFICALAGNSENEMLMTNWIEALSDALHELYCEDFTRDSVLEKMSLLFLAVDEAVDDGVILSIEANSIIESVQLNSAAHVAENPRNESIFGKFFNNTRRLFNK